MNAVNQFLELVKIRYAEIEIGKLERAEIICNAREAYADGKITAEQLDAVLRLNGNEQTRTR